MRPSHRSRRHSDANRIAFDAVRAIALALPDVEEYTCYRTPAFRKRKTLVLRLREDGATIVV